MIKTLRIMVATLMLLAAGNVLALGLGQIEVKSRINQPLLAEIPIVSTTPGELQALQARLASPETFRRVGLQPPQGIAADLRFSLGNDARGRPVIRVTTAAPVNQAVLNFLIEVDWGQGRLVREYSALIDAPRTASAAMQPAITAPVVAAPNVVQRPVAQVQAPVTTVPLPPLPPVPRSAATPVVPAPAAVAETGPQPQPVIEPAPATSTIVPMPAVAPTQGVVPATPVPVASAPLQYGPVKAGETLSKIASGLEGSSSLSQNMLALLRANPDAFLGDNINLLRQGAVLRVPGRGERSSISDVDAQVIVREQMQQWRQARRPVIQPDAAVAGNASTRSSAGNQPENSAPAKPAAASTADTVKPAATSNPAPMATAKPAKAPQTTQARLAIVPAAVAGKANGTRSGTNAGGEGKMLQQQLQQRDEDLAARTEEISELKERVAELENLRQQQDQLLTMKDSELAAAQQRLADARKAATVAATAEPAAAAATQTAQQGQDPDPQASNMMPWVWGSLVVVGLALLAWLLVRRRSPPVASKTRHSFDSEALAASLRGPAVAAAVTAPKPMPLPLPAGAEAEPVVPTGAAHEDVDLMVDVTELPTTPAAHVESPTWHSGRSVKADVEPELAMPQTASPRFVPTLDELPEQPLPDVPDEPLPEPASAAQRMKLARAFLDIGDDHSAKQLLVELKDAAADPILRTEASKLLREIG